jgi:hypothetical protein
VTIYFEGAIYDQQNAFALSPIGRSTPPVVAREALTAVGIFDLREGRIMLTGSCSERAVAEWLGTTQLDLHQLVGAEAEHLVAGHADASILARHLCV